MLLLSLLLLSFLPLVLGETYGDGKGTDMVATLIISIAVFTFIFIVLWTFLIIWLSRKYNGAMQKFKERIIAVRSLVEPPPNDFMFEHFEATPKKEDKKKDKKKTEEAAMGGKVGA